MIKSNFYSPQEVRSLYGEIVPAYQAAFADAPWYEVSKCVDPEERCVAGISSLAVGVFCETCGGCPTRPAYEADAMIRRFDSLAASRPTAWYVEQNGDGVNLAVLAWTAPPSQIAEERYEDVPEMQEWIKDRFLDPDKEDARILWLDEVFANKQVQARGNLRNFGTFVSGLAESLDVPTVAYRTIEPRMLAAAMRDFGIQSTQLLSRNQDVPDRRDFVIIDTQMKRELT